MAKGFGMAADRLKGEDMTLGEALRRPRHGADDEIGGSMGPLYGVMFTEFRETRKGWQVDEDIDPRTFSAMLHSGLEGIQAIGSAKVGDKTLIDALVPAIEAFDAAIASGDMFESALDKLVIAAETGRDSTLDLVAKIGRSSRLGERSLGVLDAGATSCAIILKELSVAVKRSTAPMIAAPAGC
jgi:dihydroxyacetone kinase-like protein